MMTKIIRTASFSEKEKYLDYGDYRINLAAVGYALQALFFFITEGNPSVMILIADFIMHTGKKN